MMKIEPLNATTKTKIPVKGKPRPTRPAPKRRPSSRPTPAGNAQRRRATNLREQAARTRATSPGDAAVLDDQAARLDELAARLDELAAQAAAPQAAAGARPEEARAELDRLTELAAIDPLAAADELGIALDDDTEGDDGDAAGGGDTLPWLPGADDTGPEFRRGVVELAARVGIPPDEIWGVIGLESRFNPSSRNPAGGATGLIQWMPRWAPLPVAELAALSREAQLPHVEKFFARAGRWQKPGDAYVMTFWPAALGKPDDHVIARRGEIDPVLKADVYAVNRGLDTNGDGIITAGDVRQKLLRAIGGARRIEVDAGPIQAAEAAEAGWRAMKRAAGAVLAGLTGAGLLWLARRRGGR